MILVFRVLVQSQRACFDLKILLLKDLENGKWLNLKNREKYRLLLRRIIQLHSIKDVSMSLEGMMGRRIIIRSQSLTFRPANGVYLNWTFLQMVGMVIQKP